jgi:nucleoside-diphosphate-sugar epimerase
MARCLIVGCGCRGQSLTRELRARGHAVRGTTRTETGRAAIEAAGGEAFVGDPDRIGTLAPALAHVGVACLLLGSAAGDDEQLAALHSTRLDMLLERMLDTTVRAVVYEAAGTVDPAVLTVGVERVRYACERSLIPYVVLDHDPSEHAGWTAAAVAAVERGLMAGGHPAA